MNKTLTRIAAAAAAAAITLSLSSCGKKGDVIASKEHVYSIDKIPLEIETDYISNIMYSDGKIYIIGERSWGENPDGSLYVYEETEPAETEPAETEAPEDESAEPVEGETEVPGDDIQPASMEIAVTAVSVAEDIIVDAGAVDIAVDDDPMAEVIWCNENKMYILSLDGTKEGEVILSSQRSDETDSSGGRWMQNIKPDKDGGVTALERSYDYNFETGESSEEYFLVRYGSEGGVTSEANLKKVVDAMGDNTYINDFMPAGNGTYLLTGDGAVYITDVQGSYVEVIKSDNGGNDSWMSGLYESGGGIFFTQISSSSMVGGEYKWESKLYEIDVENKKLGNSFDVTNLNGRIINGTDKFDLLCSRDSGLVGYDIETGETTMIIDWLKSGMDTTTMNTDTTTVLPDGRILCVTYEYESSGGGGISWSNDRMIISILTEIPPEELPDRKLIKLYSLYLNTDVKRRILEFNKNSLEYEVELTSYNDYEDPATRLNNDMIAGNLPDIIVLDSYNLPVDSYISKGLLANLYDFMDKDETVNKADYLENYLKAYEVDGKLYEIVPTFSINTIVGKASLVGEDTGWTMDEFIAAVDANPDKDVFGRNYCKSDVLNNFIYSCYGNYINRETGECSFNGDDFIKLLEFCNRFPKEQDEHFWEDMDWNAYENQWRTGDTLLNMIYLQRFGSIREWELGTFGEKITFKGYPGVNGSGSSFNSYGADLAITAKANNADGAWEFVKYFLTDEYQDQCASQDSWTFPIKLSSLEKQAEASKERPYWTDSKGEKQYYDNTTWMGGQEIKIGVNTDEDNQKVMELIKSVDSVWRYDSKITEIISEEAAAYFEGQKSAKDVAEIIQNRVSNYIAENR